MMLPTLIKVFSRLIKNAQNFEKHLLGAKRVFSSILEILNLVANFIEFFKTLKE